MIDVEIEDGAWTTALPDAEALVLAAAEATLSAVQGDSDNPSPPEGARGSVVVVLLASDDVLAELNQTFRGKAGPTNVLSFPAPAGAGAHLGDIAIAYGVCMKEARDQGKRLEHHLMHLVAHGVLHLVGYDHQSESEAETMETLERRVLEGLGAPDPYQSDPHESGPDGRHDG